jgi:ATP-dependent protease HslVU (ClpYQ) peptidase subunit
MTCIVGILDKQLKQVVIGGDSAESNGCSLSIRKDTKVFENGDFVIGCTSSFRMIQLLRFSFKPPKIKSKDIYEYMCTDFINAVRSCFIDGGFTEKNSGGAETGGNFLVAYKDRLFKIQCDFQVSENLNGIDAVGCGADFALGALFSLSEQNMTTKDKVLKALEAAEFLALGVGRPFVICCT